MMSIDNRLSESNLALDFYTEKIVSWNVYFI